MFANRLLTLCLLCCSACWCQDSSTAAGDPASDQPVSGKTWSVHFQATSIGQRHGAFRSLYEGENSLPPRLEQRVSLTATFFLSLRLNPNWELVVNPELAGGRGFGQVTGIAGFTNGEIPRVSSATPTPYLARAYARFTIPLASAVERIENSQNQAAGAFPVSRFTVTTGKFALTDFFDSNSYSHDPRTQFMNWAIMYNGAWDYPADTRGYTIGSMQELRIRKWALRTAIALEPTVANGPTLDTRLGDNRGVVIEFEHDHTLAGQNGALRILAFENRERGGTFREAMRGFGIVPDLGATQRNGTRKYGFGLNVEQSLTPDVGIFGRYGWSDGKTESWAFTQVDRSLSGGLSVKGSRWRRGKDVVGLAAARNYLSGDQRSFLAAGGVGFIIGDGRLNYGSEQIVEAYYAFRVVSGWTITGDYQRIVNPAFNRDRGPVPVATLRLHWER